MKNKFLKLNLEKISEFYELKKDLGIFNKSNVEKKK